jgi:hypothetical protein
MAQRYPTYFDGIVVGAPAMRTAFSHIGGENACLSTAQVSAIQQAFAGPRDSKGRQVYPGFLFDTGDRITPWNG